MFFEYKDRVNKNLKKWILLSFSILFLGLMFLSIYIKLIQKDAASYNERSEKFTNYISSFTESGEDEDETAGIIKSIVEGFLSLFAELFNRFFGPEPIIILVTALLYMVFIFTTLGIIYSAYQFMNLFSGEIIVRLLFNGEAPYENNGLPTAYIILLALIPSFFVLSITIQAFLIFLNFGENKKNSYMKLLSDGVKATLIVITLPMLIWGGCTLMSILLKLFSILLGGATESEFLMTDKIYQSGWTSGVDKTLTGTTFAERYGKNGLAKILEELVTTGNKEIYSVFFPLIFVSVMGYCLTGLIVSLIVRLFELSLLFVWALFIVPTYVVDHGKKFHILKGQMSGKIWVFGTTLIGWNAFASFFSPITAAISNLTSTGIGSMIFDITGLGVMIAGMQFLVSVPQILGVYIGQDGGVGHKEGNGLLANAKQKITGNRGFSKRVPGDGEKNTSTKSMQGTNNVGN